jgi:hypothetical protein
MKIVFRKNRFRWQKWCIWFVYDNGKSTRLDENYHNLDDAIDTAEMIKRHVSDAHIYIPSHP